MQASKIAALLAVGIASVAVYPAGTTENAIREIDLNNPTTWWCNNNLQETVVVGMVYITFMNTSVMTEGC
jgi:hypothetical protein